MADITAIFGILLLVGIAFPGMLAAWWLLFPATVDRARLRLESTPWQTFWFGGVITAATIIPTVLLLALPFGPAKFAGWFIIALLVGLSSLGSAGIAAKMAQTLSGRSGFSQAAAFVSGAVALELAVIFPVIGWFFVLPLTIVSALGATGFALLRWQPKTTAILAPHANPTQIS